MMPKIITKKTVYLVRHGKSDRGQGLPDKQRPILPQAQEDIKLVCTELKKHVTEKIHLVSSTALRAVQTAKLIKEEMEDQIETFLLDEKLYTFDYEDVKIYIRRMLNQWDKVMLVGHNPGFTELNNYFTYSSLDNLPTSGLIQLDFPGVECWYDTERAQQILELFPKKLRGEK